MEVRELRNFLVKSKTSTYANGKEGTVLEDGSKELVFEEKDFRYRDRYSGFNPFIGEEIVFRKGRLLWGMNYYGVVSSRTVSPKKVYDFLQEALRRMDEKRPFRGPENYVHGQFSYVNWVEGTITRFRGKEKILYKGTEIYELFYHGGVIRPHQCRKREV